MNASQTPLCPPRPYRGAPSLEKPRVICPGNPCHLHPDVYTLLWQGSPPSLRNGSGTWGTGKIIYVKSTSSEARHGAILPQRPCFYHPQSPGPPGGATDPGRSIHTGSLLEALSPAGVEKSPTGKPKFLSGTWLPRLPRPPLRQTQRQQDLTRNLTWVLLRSHFSRGLVGLRAVGSRPVLSFTLALS